MPATKPPRSTNRVRDGLLSALEGLYARHGAGRSAAEDRSVLAELDLLRRGERVLPAGVSLEWLGTAGFRLSCEGTTILIDPFLTRRSLGETLGSPSVRTDPDVVARLAPDADAVLLGHCHFDHAMDVPELARRGAAVYGSSNVVRLLGLHGLADTAVEVDPQAVYEIGPFTVRFVPSRHSKLVLGLAVPSDGELTCDSLDSLSSSAYRCGQVYGIHIEVDGTTIYHLGSADLIDDEYRLGPVDLLLCCIAGRSMTRRFTPRMLSTFDPSLVVPHHLDDFFAPIDAPMGLSLNIDVSGFVDDVRRVDPSLSLATLTPFRPYRA